MRLNSARQQLTTLALTPSLLLLRAVTPCRGASPRPRATPLPFPPPLSRRHGILRKRDNYTCSTPKSSCSLDNAGVDGNGILAVEEVARLAA